MKETDYLVNGSCNGRRAIQTTTCLKGWFYTLCMSCFICLLSSCSTKPTHPTLVNEYPKIYPDYIGVTIPVDIAPLNFNFINEDIECMDVVVRGSKGGEIHANGEYVDFDIEEWKQLTEQNKGGTLSFNLCVKKDGNWIQYKDFTMTVSNYPLEDFGLTYRRITPGYEVGGNIGIYQRDLHSFKEFAIITETTVPGRCFNCHTANQANPRQFTMQMRGEGGGTLIQKDGKQRWLETKTDSTKAAGSYAYWHPSGNYCAYAVNAVHQSFFVGTKQRIEAYHSFGDLMVLDVRTNELLLSPFLQTPDLEIFPAFSPDGKTLYFSTSESCQVPAEYEKVKCSLCKISFDAATGTFGNQVDTLINAKETGKSVTFARPSFDGRWLMYCMSDRSNFPICQSDADLWLMDLTTGKSRPIKEVNSKETDSFHNWSSDSHWFVFSSKRENGMYAQLFLACIDDNGQVSKPFLLPQRNPRKFYREMMDSYNVPDFTKTKVEFDAHEAYQQVFYNKREQVKIR